MTDLWYNLSDPEAERLSAHVSAVRVVTSSLWPFLAGASDREDFVNRLELRRDRIYSEAAKYSPQDGEEIAKRVEAAYCRDFELMLAAKTATSKQAASYYGGDPHTIVVRYPSSCAKCNTAIKKGERAFYYPNSKQMYCLDKNGCGEANRRDFDSARADEDFYNRNASAKQGARELCPICHQAPDTDEHAEEAHGDYYTSPRYWDNAPDDDRFAPVASLTHTAESAEFPNSSTHTAVAPSHVVVDNFDGTVYHRGPGGRLFDQHSAQMFATSRNMDQRGQSPRYSVHALHSLSQTGRSNGESKSASRHIATNLSRHHYNLIAQALNHYVTDNPGSEGVADTFAQHLAEDNPHFNPERFRKAVERGVANVRWDAPMTAKHFSTIASAIRDLPDDQRDAVAKHFSNILPATSPRFNRDTFLRAAVGNKVIRAASVSYEIGEYGQIRTLPKVASGNDAEMGPVVVRYPSTDTWLSEHPEPFVIECDQHGRIGTSQREDEALRIGHTHNMLKHYRNRSEASQKTADLAPYYIREEDGHYKVVNSHGETKGTFSSRDEARQQQKALYANIPDAAEKAEKAHGHTPEAVQEAGKKPKKESVLRRLVRKVAAPSNHLLRPCPVCGREIPVGEIAAHMRVHHPHSAIPLDDLAATSKTAQGNPFTDNNPFTTDNPFTPDPGSGNTGLNGNSDVDSSTLPMLPSTPVNQPNPQANPSLTPLQDLNVPENLNPRSAASHSARMEMVTKIADDLRYANPGLTEPEVIHLATQTIERYPSLLVEARGGADYIDGETLTDCPQCGKPAMSTDSGVCHNCGYVEIS